MSCFYVLEVKPLPITSFANIFSQSIGCHFILRIGVICLFLLLFLLPWETDLRKYWLAMFLKRKVALRFCLLLYLIVMIHFKLVSAFFFPFIC